MRTRIFGVILVLAALEARILAVEKPGPIGILGAMAVEIMPIEEKLVNQKEHLIEKFRFVTGEIYGKSIVMAPMGVGKVNAAIISTLLIEHFKPSRVILTGFAGGINPDLLFGDIVIAEKVAQHDLGILRKDKFELAGFKSPLEGQKSPVFYPADAMMLALAEIGAREIKLEKFRINEADRIPNIVKGIVVTGDALVFSDGKKKELRESLQADAVEMEGAAVAYVCWLQEVPCLIIRSIIDSADERGNANGVDCSAISAKNSSMLVLYLLKKLSPSENDSLFKD